MSGSFASICRRACDSNATRPLGRDGERRSANATSEAGGAKRRICEISRSLFQVSHSPLTPQQLPKKHFGRIYSIFLRHYNPAGHPLVSPDDTLTTRMLTICQYHPHHHIPSLQTSPAKITHPHYTCFLPPPRKNAGGTSNSADTSFRYLEICRCCGHTASHAPQQTHSFARPRVPAIFR